MRILIIGNTDGKLDEGMKNSTYHLYNGLLKQNKVILKNPRSLVNYSSITDVKHFSPDIIHYTMGPTIQGLLLLKLLNIVLKQTKFVISTPRPQITPFQMKFLLGFVPSLALVQSSFHNNYFNELGFKTIFFPPGVDLNKFHPISSEYKQNLKDDLGFRRFDKIILHVGQITKVREVDKLISVQEKTKYQVIIIGASSIKPDSEIKEKLINSGIIVIDEFLDNLEEYYQISDVFIFPGTKTSLVGEASAIEIPLSVLEAMACGLPVISGRFGGLPDLFQEDSCFKYADNTKSILFKINEISFNCVSNREKVIDFSWDKLVLKLLKIYQEILNENKY